MGENVLPREEWLEQHRENPFFLETCPPPDVFEMSSSKLREACLQALGLSVDASQSQVRDKVANFNVGDVHTCLRDAVCPFMSTTSTAVYAKAVQDGNAGWATSPHDRATPQAKTNGCFNWLRIYCTVN